ncbi:MULTISPECIES: NAD(P)H-dependent oxidoreductase [Citrobacter]|uniref:NAD(P)H-dependent oxidoreductase n=1 Tax=Citrobacter TaxID=544 RepID=UPI000E3DEF47|nr:MULTISPECIES: NAD(P)H-dependent oxidoreductase [Citrobacter]MBD0826526.1 NAD(P)H-dependent oxidoreductase [Citrobacter sp. C1]RFU93255.1 flavodoxin family protein [Citrobacter gillenii]
MTKSPIEKNEANDVAGLDRREFIKVGLVMTAAVLAPGSAAGGAIGSVPVNAKRILIINAHQKYPGISEGTLNRSLATLIKDEMLNKGYEVKETNIEQGYNVDEEVKKHLWADIIITQSPVFWFGMPWIYKKYVDEIFTAGMLQQSFISGDGRDASDPGRQYGSGGKLQGKKYMLSLTMNSPKQAFDDKNQKLHSGLSVDDVFHSTTAVYKFCGVDVLPIFGSYDVIQSPQVNNDMDRLKQYLAHL